MASPEDHKHISTVLIPELLANFSKWAQEYQQERDLGLRGEFVGLYRKTRKLKTLFWDSEYPAADRGWREGPRTIIMEVAAHALLMLCDWDKEHPAAEPTTLGEESEEEGEYSNCGRCNPARGHTRGHQCAKRHTEEEGSIEEHPVVSEQELEYVNCLLCNSSRGHTYGHSCAKKKGRVEVEVDEDEV